MPENYIHDINKVLLLLKIRGALQYLVWYIFLD